MERKGVIAAGNMLVDHVHQIVQWPERGWLAEITRSERATGGAPLNVLLTLAKMHTGLPLQAVGLIGQDSDGDYIMAMLEQYHVNRQHVQRTTFAPTSMSQVMTDPSGQRTFFHSPGANRLLTRSDSVEVFDRTIDVLIMRLRRKIEIKPHQPMLIKTLRGLGYVFAADVQHHDKAA